MKKAKIIAVTALSCSLISSGIFAEILDGNDLYIPGYSTSALLQPSQNFHLFSLDTILQQYVVLDSAQYRKTIDSSRNAVTQLITALQPYRSQDLNEQVAFITQQLTDIPYLGTGAMGEGDWQPTSSTYQGGAVHLKQDPVYRLDGLNCMTFVQIAMALLHADSLDTFDQHILKIAYGAAGELSEGAVHFYNRNSFTDGDFNPINERNGWLTDATSEGDLKNYVKTTTAAITRNNWFLTQGKLLGIKNIRILSDNSDTTGPDMIQRFDTVYSKLNFPRFEKEDVTTIYLPKEQLAKQQPDGSYQANQIVLNKIPTPAVVEVVRDIKKWTLPNGTNFKDFIGSELSISHMGLLYRQTFTQGQTIYQQITCRRDANQNKICDVTPVTCQEKRSTYNTKLNQCTELMFAQATIAYPSDPIIYYWYQKGDNYVCSPDKPADNGKYTLCNRVERLPLSDYITRKQYTNAPFMDTVSILGIHVEKLL